MFSEGVNLVIRGFDWRKRNKLRILLKDYGYVIDIWHKVNMPTLGASCWNGSDLPHEDEAEELAQAIWKVNGSRCNVRIDTVSIENQWEFGDEVQ